MAISSSQKSLHKPFFAAGILTPFHPGKRLLSGKPPMAFLFPRPRYSRGDCIGFTPISLLPVSIKNDHKKFLYLLVANYSIFNSQCQWGICSRRHRIDMTR